MSDLALEKVEAGEATASEARHVISELLKEGSEKPGAPLRHSGIVGLEHPGEPAA